MYTQLVGGVPDKLMHCVEDTRATTGPVTDIFQHLPRKAYINLVIRIKQLFPSEDPWVQALPGPLGTLLEIRGGTVEVTPVVVVHGPFKYPCYNYTYPQDGLSLIVLSVHVEVTIIMSLRLCAKF